MGKISIRSEINQYLNNLSNLEIHDLSKKTTNILINNNTWNDFSVVLAFLSFGKEFETTPLIELALKQGKKVAVPRIYGKEMKFHYINSLKDKFDINRWEIREPLTSTTFWTPEDGKALMVTPGLAFNKNGGRLGRGGGFYDRYLSEYGDFLTTVGLCFEQQIRDDFPVNEHDYILDAVCSDIQFQSIGLL